MYRIITMKVEDIRHWLNVIIQCPIPFMHPFKNVNRLVKANLS